jgi:hypothetical protein
VCLCVCKHMDVRVYICVSYPQTDTEAEFTGTNDTTGTTGTADTADTTDTTDTTNTAGRSSSYAGCRDPKCGARATQGESHIC